MKKNAFLVLLLMMFSALSASAQPMLGTPDNVSVLTEEKEVNTVRQGNAFLSGDMTVTLNDKDGVLTFSLQSPTQPVKAVKVRWNRRAAADALYLGDHWERGYGDLQWTTLDAQRVMPWYFLAYDGKATSAYGVMTGCRAMCSWSVSHDFITLTLDVRSGTHGVRLGSRELEMATVVTCQSTAEERPFSTLRRFCKMMCPKPRLPKQPVYGINDWYFAYGNNSDSLILQTVDMIQPLVPDNGNRPYCLIDAGWACIAPGKTSANCWSDNFYTPGPHFKDMKQLATDIKKRGMRPGLWMRPLCAPHDAPERRLMPKYQRTDSPDDRILDPTVEENREYIRKCFRTYQDWGYEMVKHDFSTVDILGKWGFEMMRDGDITQDDWTFHRQDMTTAEVFLQLYQDIREAAGDICLIGCNTISHLAAGIFELQRVGDDTSGKEWERTRKMGVNTLAFRAAQHNTFYAADADCVGLTTDIDWQKNKQWMQLLAYSGTPLFISAQPEALGEEQRAFIRQCFKQASEEHSVGEPVDWLSTLVPQRWVLDGDTVTFNWYDVSPIRLTATDCGIAGDGTTLNTERIQACIDRLSSDGGGTLTFPKGRYLTGTLELKSNVNIVLEAGAVLLGSTDPRHYHKVEAKDAPRSPRDADNSKLALLVAYRADNISITGPGIIDGQGRELALTVDSLLYVSDADYRKKKHTAQGARPPETYRPKVINFNSCSHVTVAGCTIRNSACWVQTYELCDHLTVDGVTVSSRAYWNNDGLDVTDCRNVQITNCNIDCADDGICLKSYYPGCYNDAVSVRNCTVRSSASAVKIGTASIGGFRNIDIDSIRVVDTYRSAIAIESVDGGFVENVRVSHITATNTGNPIFMRLGHRFGKKPGSIKNVLITDLTAEVPFGRPDEAYDMRGPDVPFLHNPLPSPIVGMTDYPIENVRLQNISITCPGRASKGMAYVPLWGLDCVPECVSDYPEFTMFGELPAWGFYVRHVKNIMMENVSLHVAADDFRPAIVLDDVNSFVKKNITLPESNNRIIENSKQ